MHSSATYLTHPFSEAKSQIAIVGWIFSLFTSFNLGTAIVAESLYGQGVILTLHPNKETLFYSLSSRSPCSTSETKQSQQKTAIAD